MGRLVLKHKAALTVAIISLAVAIPATRRAVTELRPGWDASHRFTLPNGWRLTPAGQTEPLPGDMPANILVLKDGKRALVNTCGYHDHSLNLVDIESGKVLQSVPFKRSWVGLGLLPSGDAFVSGGQADNSHEAVHRITIGESLEPEAGFNLPGVELESQFVSSILPTRNGLLVLNIQTDEVQLLDENQKMVAQTKVGYRPYRAALAPDGATVAVSDWGDKSVTLLDSKTLEHKNTIATRSMPSALQYAPDGRLFVTESGSNTVAVIQAGTVTERVRTGIDPTIPIGTTPEALVMSSDAKTLYVANAGNNCVAVIDISHPGSSRVKGLIPTERYPTALALTPDDKKLIICTAKGYYGPNAAKNAPGAKRLRSRGDRPAYHYIGDQLEGRLAIVDVSHPDQLKDWTRECYLNRPRGLDAAPSEAIRSRIQRGAFDKIKHVVYVIRENRTYDQVLGDIGKGESDPSLTLFGQKVTPNGHKIASSFTLLDNLYTDGEVSQAGHQWTDSAYANDYTEHQWILSYSRHGEVKSDPRLTSSPGDYLWSLARRHGVRARVFGEYVDVQEDHDSLQNPKIKADPEKYGYSAPFEKIFARGGRDVEKVDEFLAEMKASENTHDWPQVMVMALPEDHTRGMNAGALSPAAMVGDNDLAVGKLVEGVSHSSFWKNTAIFIIEDDGQDGADHVDSHRTVGLVISPYVQRGVIDGTMYSTASMLRTMELIMGLPPMTQYDAKATPMYAAFTDRPVFDPYDLVPAQIDLNERNPAGTVLARRSSKLDFSDIDRADPDEFNHILWEAYRPREPYPARLR